MQTNPYLKKYIKYREANAKRDDSPKRIITNSQAFQAIEAPLQRLKRLVNYK